MTRIGVDIGGTKTEAVAVTFDGSDAPAILAKDRIPTAKDEGYDAIVANTSRLIRDVAKSAGLALETTGVGVGMPGSVTSRNADGTPSASPLVKNSNATVLNGKPFRADLSAALGCEIAFSNDANCFALAEATWGAARGGRVVFGVIMGTGVGGGVVLRDGASADGRARAWDGAQGIAGEWGHVVLDPDGPPCYCGRRGCIEQYLSGPAIERAYEARAGVKRTVAEIAASDDAVAKTLLEERTDVFGRALAIIIDVLDPDVIVLGGGVSNLPRWTAEGRDAAARWVFNDTLETKIVRHALGDSAGVLGAALLPR